MKSKSHFFHLVFEFVILERTIVETNHVVREAELEKYSRTGEMFSQLRKLFLDVVRIVGKRDAHDLVSLHSEWSEFFRLDGSETFLAEKLHRNDRVTIDRALDILSQFGLVEAHLS